MTTPQQEQEHPSLKLPDTRDEIVVTPFQALEQVDLSKLREKAKGIVEAVQQIIDDADTELDALSKDVLLLVKKRLEKTE